MNKEGCQACGIAPGKKIYGEVLAEYRGHNLCSWCESHWKEREEKHGRAIEFDEFKTGIRPKKQTRKEQIRKSSGTVKELAVKFGVSHMTIRRALRD